MEDKIKKHIDAELYEVLSKSEWSQIDYENLLKYNPAKIREEERLLSLTEAPVQIPEQLIVENIQIPSSDEGRSIRLRTYKPKGKTNLPILLYFHGGAFIFGTPEQYDFIFYKLALDIDAFIVSVDYRLAPEHPFPSAMKDGHDALVWLSHYADQIGGDKNYIIIGGSSAGATIAASIAHLEKDKKEIKIRHQYLLYPPTDHQLETASMQEFADAPMQTMESAKLMWKHYLNDRITNPPKYAVPLLEEDFENLPDTTIFVCELDPLKDEGIAYATKLKHANVSVDLHELKGAIHSFDFFPCTLSDNFYLQQVRIFKQILNQRK